MTRNHNYDPKRNSFVASKGEMPCLLIPDMPAEHFEIVSDYLSMGKQVGLLWSLPFLSAMIVRDEHLASARKFAELEEAYMQLGFRPISLAGFRDLAGYNRPLAFPDGCCVLAADCESFPVPRLASETVIAELSRMKNRNGS